MKPHSTDRPARKVDAAQAVVALFGTGGRRCRLAAAFVAVTVGLAGQTAAQAFAQAKEGTVLYLDAPAVSTDRATRAGETASAYSDPRSPVPPDTPAWLGVRGPRGDETEAPPQDASEAFASVTAPDARGTPGITAEAAYDAGKTMLAQIEEAAPPEDGAPGEDELAATGDVRPELGDGTQAPNGEPSAGYEAAPAEQPTTPDVASSPEPVAPVSDPVAEPSGGEGLPLEAPASAPAPTELAAAPTDDASPAPGISPDTEPDYGTTGPISEPAVEPAPAAESSTEPVVQRPEIQEPETQEPEVREPVLPSGGDEAAVLETPDSPEPGVSPAASVEPSTAPTAERVEEPEGGSEEFAGANTTPVTGPEPADETAHGDPSVAPDTGPTSGHSDAVALSPPSSPVPEDDGDSDDPVSASPAPEEAGQDDASENVSRVQISEVVVVQESDTGEGADPAASPPPDFAPPTDEAEAENGGAEDTGPPSWAPPSDETRPETATPAEQSTDNGVEEGDAPPSEAPNEQPHEQTNLGSGETATSSPVDEAEEPASDTPRGTGPGDESTAVVPDSPPSEEAPPTGGDQEGGQDTPQDPGSGKAPTEGPASPGVAPSGDPQAPPDNTEQALPPGGESGTNGPRLQADGHAGGSSRGPDRSREDHKDDSRDRRDRGHSGPASPDEWFRRIRQYDGGAETVQEKAREATGRSGITGRADKEPTPREQRSRGADAGSPEDAGEEEVPEDSQAQNYVLRTVRSAQGSGDGEQVGSAGAHEPATASPEQARNGSRAEPRAEPLAEQQAAKRAERREARRVERFAARVAERKADRRASRVLAREQGSVERAAVREESRQNRPTDGRAFDAQEYAAPSAGRNRNVPDYQETVPQPATVELAPIRQVKTQRFAPVEQPAAVELASARQVPAARLAPAAQVQPQAQSQVRQQLGSGGVGQISGGSVARVTKSVNRAAGH